MRIIRIKTALLGRDIAKLQKTEAEIKANGGIAISVSCDVTDMKSVENARDVILAELGVPTILINGAGGNQSDAITTINEFDERELGGEPQVRGFFNVDMDIFRSVIETNTMGTVIPCRVFGAEMAKAGGGSIINFASMTGFRQCSRVGAYGIAKAGIINFTSWLAAYLAPAGIRVNAIAPGFFLNDRSRKLLLKPEGGFSERGANIIRQTPMKRFGEASELIGCMNWLIDDDASGFVTGVTIPVDGGFLSCAGV
jgi:NAD(P)-dependent dehydrogenase (short-subunit alcohol dehydrogenase family)